MIIVHHNTSLLIDGIDDAETLEFCNDLQAVSSAVYQGMVIGGPWMEARVKMMIRSWLPTGWLVSGPSQIYRRDRLGIRSRSWDAVVHRWTDTDTQLPPPASPESGYPLVELDNVAMVVDTKTYFGDPKSYAAQPVFNLMNDSMEGQLEFLGPRVPKVILAAASSRSPGSLLKAAELCGLLAFSLGRYKAGPVSEAERRAVTWRLECFDDGRYPLQAFKTALLASLEQHAGSPANTITSPSASNPTPAA